MYATFRRPTARHRHVEVLTGRGRGDEHVGSVDGQPLGGVGRGGIAEVEVLGHIPSWQHNGVPTTARCTVGAQPPDLDGPITQDIDDLPTVAVADEGTGQQILGSGDAAVVAPGDDDVAHARLQSVTQADGAAAAGGADEESVGAGSFVELSDGVAVVGNQESNMTIGGVCLPRGRRHRQSCPRWCR